MRGLTGSRASSVVALVAAQVRLVRAGSWWSSAVVMALGFFVAWAAGRTALIGAVAPLVAVFSVSRLYGPHDDPAFELAQATPTSPRQVLLARLVLVFGLTAAERLMTMLSALRYHVLVVRREQLVLPGGLWALFALMLVLFGRERGRQFDVTIAYLGMVLPLGAGISSRQPPGGHLTRRIAFLLTTAM